MPKHQESFDDLLTKLKVESTLLKNDVIGPSKVAFTRNLSQLNVASRRLTRKPLDPATENKA